MNANRKIRIDFRINGKHDHYIEKSTGPSVPKSRATKPYKLYHRKKEEN